MSFTVKSPIHEHFTLESGCCLVSQLGNSSTKYLPGGETRLSLKIMAHIRAELYQTRIHRNLDGLGTEGIKYLYRVQSC